MNPTARFEPGSPDDRFQKCAANFWQVYFQYYPETASHLGVAGQHHRLNPFSDDVEAAKRMQTISSLDLLQKIAVEDLSPDNAIDWRVLKGQLELSLDAYDRWDWRLRNPGAFLPIDAVYQLTIRPVPDFGFALQNRLAAIPEHLRDARHYLARDPAQIPPVWLESAYHEARGAIDFLAALPNDPRVSDAALNILPAIEAAQEACRQFAVFLEEELAPKAQGDFAVGAARFDMLLRCRHGLPVDHVALKRLGERLFHETLVALRGVTRALRGDEDVAAMTASLQADHLSAEELLPAYQQGMETVRDFVIAHELVGMPPSDRLDVVETPVFLRHRIPFAAYMDPAPNDPAQHGYYYVTPVQDVALLAEHHRLGLLHTCSHEAYPGHHLQFVLANINPFSNSYARLINSSATLFEGWALYCEQLMAEQGLLQRPENQFILLRDRLWRALRILIDVGIQCEGMSAREAASLLVTHLGFPQAQADGELTWYSQAPSTPMGYATGWAMINALRDETVKEATPLTLKSFHDRLLNVGSIGLPWVMERAFGEQTARTVMDRIFKDQP